MKNIATKPIFQKARNYRMRIAWFVWMIASLFLVFQFFLQLSSGVIISGVMKSFALTAFGAGILSSSYYYIYVLLQIPAGMLMDRFGPRKILSTAALVICAGGFIFSSAQTVFIALAGRILMGTGAAFAFVGCLQLTSIWFPRRLFALMVGADETVGVAGVLIGNFWLSHVVQVMGWRECMIWASLGAGIISILLYSIVRNSPRRTKNFMNPIARMPLREGLKKLLKRKICWINGLYSGMVFSIITVFAALWAIPFLETAHHLSLPSATMLVAMTYVGLAINGPITGWLDGHTFARRKIAVSYALAGCASMSAVIFATHLPLYAVAILLLITGMCASSEVVTFAIAGEIADENNRATSLGFTNMLCVITAPILQPLVGFILTQLNHHKGFHPSLFHFSMAMSILPLTLFFAAILGFFLPRKIK